MQDTLTDNFNLKLSYELREIENNLKKKWERFKYGNFVYIFHNSKEILEKIPLQILRAVAFEKGETNDGAVYKKYTSLALYFKPFLENNDPVGFFQDCFRNKGLRKVACLRFDNSSSYDKSILTRLSKKYFLSKCSSGGDYIIFYDIDIKEELGKDFYFIDSTSREYAEVYWEGLRKKYNEEAPLKPLKELREKLLREVL